MAKNEVIERFAIQDLLARYAHAIDDLNPEEWARCFTPDGVFQLGSQALRGHAALRAYGEVHVREIRCRHMTGNFLYKIDGNKATGKQVSWPHWPHPAAISFSPRAGTSTSSSNSVGSGLLLIGAWT
jgi:hypothetical protein